MDLESFQLYARGERGLDSTPQNSFFDVPLPVPAPLQPAPTEVLVFDHAVPYIGVIPA